jgi:hypothetical protein
VGFYRFKAAHYFVLALGAGIETLQALRNRVFNALIITKLKVQLVVLSGAAPVAAVEGIAAVKVQGASNGLVVFVGHGFTQLQKKANNLYPKKALTRRTCLRTLCGRR